MLEVGAAEDGWRADKLVVERLARAGRAVPRAEVQRWMSAGTVTCDGRAVDKNDRLRAGARVRVEPAAAPWSDAAPDPSVRFEVVYQDDDLLVIDKPAGLVVHPARGHRGGTLVNGLLARGGFDAAGADPRDPEGHLRPGIVHRIDKDTSGLLVVARTAACREALKALFTRHDIERSYLAIVVGTPRSCTIDTPHGRHPKSRLKFTSRLPSDRPGSKRAVTKVEPLCDLGGAALVRCTLETGRTHQIRVHLSEQCGTPILADPLYGRRPGDERLARVAAALGCQALHAAVLGFVHPASGERMRWESLPPPDMQRALDELLATRPST